MTKKHWLAGALAVTLSLASTGTALADFAAIAFSKQTGADGYAYGFGSRAQAEQRALQECRVQGPGCRVIVHVRNGCAALAVGNGNGFGYAWAGTRQQAEARAMSECRQRNRGCTARVWTCSG